MAPLEQQQPQLADRSGMSQRLDMPQVELPPEESSINLTQLVPELDLLGEKGKDKKDESDEEEVGGNILFFFSFFFLRTKPLEEIGEEPIAFVSFHTQKNINVE